ncbi:MAG: M48 family metallopeptidase [Bacillus sp. (in: firmicutes)]
MNEQPTRNLVHPKENVYLAFSLIVSITLYVIFVFSLIGIAIILIIALISYFFHAINIAQIRRNAVKISPDQFPEIYSRAVVLAEEMGLKKVPAMYVLESMGILNAFATRFFGKNMVVMYSEIFDLIEDKKEDELMFVLAHEFAHLKRRHVLMHIFILPAMWIPFLGEAYMRACEYTCDRYAAYYINNIEAAQNALTILAIGKKLHPRVNQDAFIAQLEEEKGFFAWLSEKISTHPDLPKRMNALQYWNSPEEYSLFKERKRNLALGCVPIIIIPAILFGGYYLFKNPISDFFEYIMSDEYEDYEDDEVEGVTELMQAASLDDVQVIKEEIGGGADVNARDSQESTALFYAVYNSAYEAAELLIEAGSDINAQDYYKDTPLMMAAHYGDEEMALILIKNGADLSIENEDGFTAYDYAEQEGNQEIMDLLKNS